jgi:hypothetical protein
MDKLLSFQDLKSLLCKTRKNIKVVYWVPGTTETYEMKNPLWSCLFVSDFCGYVDNRSISVCNDYFKMGLMILILAL